MRLTGFHIDGFGIFHNVLVKDIPPGTVIFLGNNEAGKSTLLAFLRTVFFGFPRKDSSKERFYPPLKGGNLGGRIFLHHNTLGDIVLERRQGKAGGILSAHIVQSGQKIDPAEILGGVTPELFKNVYAFSLSDLQSFKDLDSEAIRSAIYGASAGAGMSLIPRAQTELCRRMDALFRPRGREQEINRRLSELEDIRARLEELYAASGRFGDIKEALKAKEMELADINSKLSVLKKQYSTIEMYKRLWPDWMQFKMVKAELAGLPALPDNFPEDGITSLDKLLERQEEGIKKAETLLRDYSTLCAEIEALKVDDALISHENAIKEAFNKRDLYLHLKDELGMALSQANDIRTELEKKKNIMIAEGWWDKHALLAQKNAIATLSRRISEFKECLKSLDLLKDAIEDRKKLIDGLKKDIEGRKRSARRKHLIFSSATAFLAVLSLFCSILSIRATHYSGGGLWAAIAGLIVICGHLIRQSLERNKTINEMAARLSGLEEEVAQKAAEQDLLNSRKTELKEEMEQLKTMTGLSGEVTQEVLDEASSAIERAFAAHNEIKEAHDRLERLLAAIKEKEDAIKRYDMEVMAIFKALNRPLEKDGGVPADIIKALDDELRFNSNNLIKREEKERQKVHLCEEFSSLEEKLGLLTRDISALIKRGGANDEEEFRRLCGIHQKKNSILKEINELEARLKKASGEKDIEELGRILEGMDMDMLNTRSERLITEIDTFEKESADKNQTIGALKREMEQIISSEDKITVLRAEEERLIAEIRMLSMKWGALCLAAHIIKETKRIFETEQQPKVIKDASGFLKTITGGAYDRIIIPLEGSIVEAAGPGGARKRPEELSRGTAEQLFLALRLGYILNCAEKCMTMPIIMDDILVNFDPSRTANTASAILKIAEINQVLFFTCHPETVSVFKKYAPAIKVYEFRDGLIEDAI
ncbi:MAG: AAA family ATPase [Dissulfurimicrobium sp.]|uniref:AAA family ATPase n=1 Tax=Dissulfurimicrobium sp. TaxID=2022436 RepID=UPI00404A0564